MPLLGINLFTCTTGSSQVFCQSQNNAGSPRLVLHCAPGSSKNNPNKVVLRLLLSLIALSRALLATREGLTTRPSKGPLLYVWCYTMAVDTEGSD